MMFCDKIENNNYQFYFFIYCLHCIPASKRWTAIAVTNNVTLVETRTSSNKDFTVLCDIHYYSSASDGPNCKISGIQKYCMDNTVINQ